MCLLPAWAIRWLEASVARRVLFSVLLSLIGLFVSTSKMVSKTLLSTFAVLAMPVVVSLLAATHSRTAALASAALSVLVVLLAQVWALTTARA